MKPSTITYQMSEIDRRQHTLTDDIDHFIRYYHQFDNPLLTKSCIINDHLLTNDRRSDNTYPIINQVTHLL